MTKDLENTVDRRTDDFASVMQIIRQNRTQALRAVNNASILTAWQVGAFVSDRIKNAGWGAKVVQQLAEYIHTQEPTIRGWSKVTIYRMVKLYDLYSDEEFTKLVNSLSIKPIYPIAPFVSSTMTPLQQKAISTQTANPQIVSFRMTQIPELLLHTGWTNHQIIMQRCSNYEQCVFYILYSEYEQLKNKELERAIKTDTFSRVLSDKKLQSDMLKSTYPSAQLLLKDTAVLDMLGLPRKYNEHKLRKGIVKHIKDFILDMGKDFLFIDEEHTLEVGGKRFRCDLLFFHRALQCMVAIELKTTEFDPRDLGQLEFYLEALDQAERRSNENPSIGILMCKDANTEVVRYALNRSMSPTMITRYKEQLQVGSVIQRSLEEFTEFISKQKNTVDHKEET